ncbi:hypothetical protein B484DRAFT_449521 [Ochromonadaceae sp. CCMP2298]|nr:hypothetical protein B484DRAFT_449521 [Ochromonadaceae sp. CCMP2298]
MLRRSSCQRACAVPPLCVPQPTPRASVRPAPPPCCVRFLKAVAPSPAPIAPH